MPNILGGWSPLAPDQQACFIDRVVSIFNRQFLIVVGKGGTGKSAVAATLALEAQRRGKKTLLALCNAKERLSRWFDTPPITTSISKIDSKISAVNMTPQEALAEYGRMVLKSETVYRAVMGNAVSQAVLRGTPGIEAWSMLGKAYFHSVKDLDHGQPRFDLVILDAPATGHALEMFRVPRVLLDVAPRGILRREAEGAVDLFTDQRRTNTVLVSLPEEMPMVESFELRDKLKELDIETSLVAINQCVAPLFPDNTEVMINQIPDDALRGLAQNRYERERSEQVHITKVRQTNIPFLTLPKLSSAAFAKPQLTELQTRFNDV